LSLLLFWEITWHMLDLWLYVSTYFSGETLFY
jgi:hypothetical protein